MSILPEHERCFHEGRPGWLASQAKIEHGSIVEIILRISTHASVELLLIWEDGVWGSVAFHIGVCFVVERVCSRGIAFFVTCLLLFLAFIVVLARCFVYLFLDWLFYFIFFYIQSLGKLPPILGNIEISTQMKRLEILYKWYLLVTVDGTISQIELTLSVACHVVLIVSTELIR